MTGRAERPPSPLHEPVMLRETVRAFQPFPGGVFIDATLGDGGHGEAILQSVAGIEKYIGIDRDGDAIRAARARLADSTVPCEFRRGDFRDLAELAGGEARGRAGGALFDLGVSARHLDEGGRGFSYRMDAPLDMRMDRRQERNARDAVNGMSEADLSDLFYRLGEVRNARAVARAIVRAREAAPIETTFDLVNALDSTLSPRWKNKSLSRIFQALRIYVNDEIESLEKGLSAAIDLLAPGGRIAVIAYHSGEDRPVKKMLHGWARGCVCPPHLPACRCGRTPVLRLLPRRALRPTEEEVARNPRARSARLRVAEKIATEGDRTGGSE